MTRIAIVGMACRYPDAATPGELWDNAVAGRRAFRRLPDERMRLDDYWDSDPATPDTFYARNAAVLEGYEFDRIAHKIAGSTFRSTDLTHWLALDTAGRALADAGFPAGEGLPRERTGVIVGNTLTGEFARANVMRLRWPYVRRVMAEALAGQEDWDEERVAEFLGDVEAAYKEPFPAIDEDTLAGGLSNTIAGRICNHFDLNGGGYTVDGACSSSLLSVTTAGTSLVNGDIDVAVAGGVDLSIDPFEIIGFAKTGALAKGEMKLYDRGSNGFWPGEGCGMIVLMREEDALAGGHRIYATIAGWGVSSDGQGGITRPEVSGYQLALRRAYERAGFGIETVRLFEGHGTGTAVGDATELTALMGARAEADPQAPVAAITSIKGMIGHTKAAAGVAGLIKAALAVDNQTLPPAIGTVDPHELLTQDGANLKVLRKAEAWPKGAPRRVGITAMGFGGINTHVVLDEPASRRRAAASRRSAALASSPQDSELLLLEGDSPRGLLARAGEVSRFVARVSYGQVSDLAATLQRELRGLPYRAAIVASSPEDAERRLQHLSDLLESGETSHTSADGRSFLGKANGRGRIGFLFPGQGSGKGTGGGALRRRFPEAAEVFDRAGLPATGDMVATDVAQPRIATGSAAGLRVLDSLRLEASLAVGHSLGELSALHWAGALDEETLLDAARVRGKAMAEHSASGTMASLGTDPEQAGQLIAGLTAVIAGYNGPRQTVVAGPVEEIEEIQRRAERADVSCTRLAVSHAFHSPLVAPAAAAFGNWLAGARFGPVSGKVVSTVTGAELERRTDVVELLSRQITDPVRFTQAVQAAAAEVDLFVEVGPGRVLSGLAQATTGIPALSLNTDDESLRPLLQVAGAAFVAGAPVALDRLFQDRLIKPLEVGQEFSFLTSPCEQPPKSAQSAQAAEHRTPAAAPAADSAQKAAKAAKAIKAAKAVKALKAAEAVQEPTPDPAASSSDGDAALEILRNLVAERAELPADLVDPASRLLDDLHMSSITVGQIVNQAASHLKIPASQVPTNFATATLAELAEALQILASTGGAEQNDEAPPVVAGAATWARPFAVDLDEIARPRTAPTEAGGSWELFAPEGGAHAERLRQELEQAGVGSGVLAVLPKGISQEQMFQILDVAKSALTGRRDRRFVLVQDGRGAAGLAKTLYLEAPHLRTTIVHTPMTDDAVERVLAEVAATTRFTEVHYDEDGVRRVPTLRALPAAQEREDAPLNASDVLLVTGGGKGISAECALAVARKTGTKLAVLGRSDPADDRELADNLRRMADAGVGVHYARADVTDAGQVRGAVAELEGALGKITGLLHGAGRNEPNGLVHLEADDFRRTFAPKVDGLRTVLDTVGAGNLKLLVAFGSIIGRAGLRGEAHYATANEWLADLTEEVARTHPQVRARCMEWSVWSGVGMGEKLSVVESLNREGITPVSPDQGVAILLRLISDPDAPVVSVISGRTEGIDTVRRDLPALPLLRFTSNPLVRYHGVELVTEVELNAGTDPYLADHLLDGNLLMPAVMGMEAMVQVGAAATGRSTTPVIEGAKFLRPIVVPPNGSTRIRIAATVTGTDTVDVAIHAEDTGFVADHFRARLVYTEVPAPEGPPLQVPADTPLVPLDPARDLYGSVLFQGARFQRLSRFHRAAARHVDADVDVQRTPQNWFAGFLPGELLLADPGMRDALMHGNQVCVPDATLLPSGVERIHPLGNGPHVPDKLRYAAIERSRDGDTYVYDIAVRAEDGTVVERWEGLTLHAVRKTDGSGPWVAPLLGPYLERTLEDVLGARIAVAVEPHGESPAGSVSQRRSFTADAAARAMGAPVTVNHRPDGRPELEGSRHMSMSAAHGLGVTVSAVSGSEVACDIEAVSMRPASEWRGLLGEHTPVAELVAKETGEAPDTAATRVWSASECLKKAGIYVGAPLTVLPSRKDAWVVFAAGDLRIATFVTALRDALEPAVFAFLTNEADLIEGRS
ncbi:erythronolide synthase [Streptomyces sp. CB00455]|uniref:type I polyketide synthase n=1 Tax=Streptomyces sp. CB00455 TaxID=1703927 RepID=UPI00093F4DE5|nr:type I polyketide synthase [Streptomyces sp. CB00455]OKK14307.1 erythronolide synthase [Streptomyces sp. CB00455]